MPSKKQVQSKKPTKQPVKKKQSSSRFSPKARNLSILVFVLLFALIGSYFVFFSKASAPTLTWAPPSGYQNFPVKSVAVATGSQTINGGGGDMLIKLPSSPTGPINITNCRNAVLIGGQINIPPNSGPGTDQRGIYITGCTGTVHIEGVYINGDIATAEGDGVAINAPNAIVQLQNMRIYKLYGGFNTASHNHSDIVQPWGGVKELRIDYMTGSSNYQGFQINDDINHIGKVTIKNTNIGDSGVAPPDGKGGYYLWVKCGTGTTYSFSNFYVQPRSGKSLGSSLWDGGCGLSASSSSATYTNGAVSGSITGGKPAAGDFVPAGSAGIGYSSPGYGGVTTTPTPPPTTPTPPPTPTPTTPPPAPTTTTTKTVISSSYDSTSTSMEPVSGTWAIKSGRYALTTANGGETGNANIAINPITVAGDFTLTANGLSQSSSGKYDDFSIIFNYVDSSNYYYASFNETNDDGTNGIFKVKNGAMLQLKDFTSVIKSGTDYKIGINKKGSTITVTRDGAAIGSISDGDFTTGKVGFGTRNNPASFDNLLVTQ